MLHPGHRTRSPLRYLPWLAPASLDLGCEVYVWSIAHLNGRPRQSCSRRLLCTSSLQSRNTWHTSHALSRETLLLGYHGGQHDNLKDNSAISGEDMYTVKFAMNLSLIIHFWLKFQSCATKPRSRHHALEYRHT